MRVSGIQDLLVAARNGDRRSLARLLTLAENDGRAAELIGRHADFDPSCSHTVGLTGAPGAGKSTLTASLVTRIRAEGHRVAVLAVDPTSCFTGGAILGDRIRMAGHEADRAVFIRSLATRGQLGGLSTAAPIAARVLHSAGYQWVLIETVGVGQSEVDIVDVTDSAVVVLNPGWGDEIQANKAGLMEIADIFVINKADKEGVEATRRHVQGAIDDRAPWADWRPPVLETVATDGSGVGDLWSTLEAHRTASVASGSLVERRARQNRRTLERVVVRKLRELATSATSGPEMAELTGRVELGQIDPWSAAESLLDRLGHPVKQSA